MDFPQHNIYNLYKCNTKTGEISRIAKDNWLKGSVDRGGYCSVAVRGTDSVKHKKMFVHRFIWEAVNQQTIPIGYEIDHINCNRSDNRIVNLQCISLSENRKKAYSKRTDDIPCRAHALKKSVIA